MKRKEKNALACQRILNGAIQEFSAKGYKGASLNNICTENKISKGIIYHHFKDKDELYLHCVAECFDKLTSFLKEETNILSGTAEQKIQKYFDARFRFFAENPLFLGIFADVFLRPPAVLSAKITDCRKEFDALNISVLTELLNGKPLRKGLCIATVVEDFRIYMDFFNTHFKAEFSGEYSSEAVLREHEERCHRQLDILLYGVLDEK